MRGTLHLLAALAAAVIAAAASGVERADARMTVLYDLTPHVNALTDPSRPGALSPEADGLYQQSIARRGIAFPTDNPANPRDGLRFVSKVVATPPGAPPINCSNSYLVHDDGTPRSGPEIASLLRNGAGRVEPDGCVDNAPPAPHQNGVIAFDSGMVFVEEAGGDPSWRSWPPGSLAEQFRQAVAQLDTEPVPPAYVPGTEQYDSHPTMADRVHAYLRFPQSLTASPGTWADLRATLPMLGGVWLELYGYDNDATRAWDEARYATWLRPFARDFQASGGDLRRLHLLMRPSVRSPERDPGRRVGDQWEWARTGAACTLLRNGPGAHRVGDGDPPSPWGEFGAGFRQTFRDPAGGILPAGSPPDLAPSPVSCAPAHRLTESTSPSADTFADAVALLGGGELDLPDGAITVSPGGGAYDVNVAPGLPGWLDAGFASRAGGVVTARRGDRRTTAAVGPNGVARVLAPGAGDEPVTFTLSGLRGSALLEAASDAGGRLPDPHLSLLCPGSRLPGEQVGGGCEAVIEPEAGREWIPADDEYAWLLASANMTAPPAALDTEVPGGAVRASRAQLAQLRPLEGGGRCRFVPEREAPEDGERGRFTLSPEQLLINQRIYQAAVRRANAVEAWLSAGIEGRDICGGALTLDRFRESVDLVASNHVLPAARPRALTVAPRGPDGGEVTLSRRQVLINQRIAQAAVRRANGLRARLNGRLTGGDIKNAQLTDGQLAPQLALGGPVADLKPAPSETEIGRRRGGDPDDVTLTAAQLGINQRIGQAAVRRVNAISDDLRAGLTARNFAPASIGPTEVAWP